MEYWLYTLKTKYSGYAIYINKIKMHNIPDIVIGIERANHSHFDDAFET
jgi:hypothetical protein